MRTISELKKKKENKYRSRKLAVCCSENNHPLKNGIRLSERFSGKKKTIIPLSHHDDPRKVCNNGKHDRVRANSHSLRHANNNRFS